MSDQPTADAPDDHVVPRPTTTANAKRPPRLRARPWLTTAVAGIAGIIVLAGAGALGSEYSQNWAATTVGIAVVAAYLVDLVAPRAIQSACTAIVAFGIPVFVALAVAPVHTYNGFRLIEALTIALWVAVFVVGGTKGRALFLALAMLGAWTFAVLEAGHVQDTARVIESAIPFGVGPSRNVDFPDCELTTLDDQGNFTTNPECQAQYDAFDSEPRRIDDHTLEIALASLLFALAFMVGLAINDRRDRTGLGTAFPVPMFIATATAIVAFATKFHSVWFAGLLAVFGGLAIGALGNGRRRFTTWAGALGIGIGIVLLTGDVATKWFDSNSGLVIGLTWIFAGLVALAVTARLATSHDDDYDSSTDDPDEVSPVAVFDPPN